MREESLRMSCDKDNETGMLQKRKNISIFDRYIDEIKFLIDLGLTISKTYEKILIKLPENKKQISYNGFYKFCIRRKII